MDKLLGNGNKKRRRCLKYPSDALFALLSKVERAFLFTVHDAQLQSYTFLDISENVLRRESIRARIDYRVTVKERRT